MESLKTSSPTHFKIGNKSYNNEAAEKIVEYLNSVESNVEIADIDDIIAGRPEDEALRTLAIINSGLKRFKLLELNVSDNAMGAKGVEACRDILSGKSLQALKRSFISSRLETTQTFVTPRNFTCAMMDYLLKLLS